ncbi:MAG TPA: T9SS type A sorting domain-containing protein [Candidatus Eisenbacteria bacterium]|nr:T9SS type A sorting domain-containing protein [Candidatus Eisenbacteria bacterium]
MRFRRHLFAVLAVGGCLFAGTPGFAQDPPEPPSWLLKYISFYSNVGANPPNIGEPTIIRLHGWFPYDCGGIRDRLVIDSSHIQIRLVKASEICGDTTRTWTWDFDLGYLPLGDHTLTVTRIFVNEARTDSITESASFTFPVIDLGSPPPPEPPPGVPIPNWLMPYLAYGYTTPSQPNAQEPTTAVFHGLFPYDCGEIVDVTSDSTSIAFTMRPGAPCGDTTRTWTQSFPLGMLPAGHHLIHITRTLIWPESTVVAQADWGFDVWPDPNTPLPQPPGPPNHPSYQARCLSGWTTHAPPTTHEPVWLSLWGWFPYYCGEVVDAQVLDPHRVTLRLRPRSGPCAAVDTTAMWSIGFQLGMLLSGPHDMEVILYVEGDPLDPVVERHAFFQIFVDDREVSSSVPNPFVEGTRFSVISQREEDVDVGIYDLHGRRVSTLFKGKMAPGGREFRWNGAREDGSRAGIGMYFSRVAFSDRVITRKLVMLPR